MIRLFLLNKPDNLMLLYIILGEEWLKGRKIEQIAVRVASLGVSMIQLRESKNARKIIKDARKINTALCHYNTTFIINNRPDITLEVNADGVHIGQDDVSIYTARKILGPQKLVGVSVHSVEEAIRAENEGANYLSFGSIFPSKTKKSQIRSLSILRDIKKSVKIPIFAIGGITLEKIEQISKLHIDGICISRDILDRDNIEERVKCYKDILNLID